jgi:hypothetical protein
MHRCLSPDRSFQLPNPPAEMPMTESGLEDGDWRIATLRSSEGDVLARFDFSRRFVLRDPAFSRAIWFDLTPGIASGIDEYLAALDSLEDAVRSSMSRCGSCHMLVSLSDAAGRQLVFAYSGALSVAEAAVLSLQSDSQGDVQANILDSPRFGPFAALVQRASDGSNVLP